MATILIIDDDPNIRDMLTELFEDEGYAVVSQANGHEAICYLRSGVEHPCVILLDLMMPIMNGWQFRDAQRQDPALNTIPTVILSAVEDVQQEADILGTRDLIAKPVNIDTLLTLVENFCS